MAGLIWNKWQAYRMSVTGTSYIWDQEALHTPDVLAYSSHPPHQSSPRTWGHGTCNQHISRPQVSHSSTHSFIPAYIHAYGFLSGRRELCSPDTQQWKACLTATGSWAFVCWGWAWNSLSELNCCGWEQQAAPDLKELSLILSYSQLLDSNHSGHGPFASTDRHCGLLCWGRLPSFILSPSPFGTREWRRCKKENAPA